MPRYYLHIRREDDEIRDDEGSDLPDLKAARAEAIAGARSILSQEVLEGNLPLNERIDVENERGEILLSLDFMEAVHVRMDKQKFRARA